MNAFIKRLEEIDGNTGSVTLYRNSDVKTIMKGIGKIPGKFDAELLEFLKFTNGASILDYCFMGFKNPRLGTDLDKFMFTFWSSQQYFAGQVMAFATTSSSENFGYLIDIVDSDGRHPIVYTTYDEKMYLVGSSFNSFMETFVNDVHDTLSVSKNKVLTEVEKENWPIDLSHWIENDQRLKEVSLLPELKKIKNLLTPL